MTKNDCIFCVDDNATPANGSPADRVIKTYENWRLVIQTEAKRTKTKQSAGMLITKRHIVTPSEISAQEAAELFVIYKDASRTLCEYVGITYAGQESVGFNDGAMAGQTVDHAHVHILPVADEDPEALKIRSGIGGAFEALRSERLGYNSSRTPK